MVIPKEDAGDSRDHCPCKSLVPECRSPQLSANKKPTRRKDIPHKQAFAPKPYSVHPECFGVHTTSSAVTVVRFACSVYVTDSRIT